MNTEKIINHICTWLNDYSNKSTTNGFIIGISGGIDSAVTSTLIAKTGKPVICIEMPINQNKLQVERGKKHISWLKKKFPNVSSIELDLTKVFTTFIKEAKKKHKTNKLAQANTRARLRMTTLYYFAQINNYLVVGTGNKVEDFGIGFFTKYGDGGVDISPIADLLKTEVFTLGKYLDINKDIINATPTDGLWDEDKSDEEQIGAKYKPRK